MPAEWVVPTLFARSDAGQGWRSHERSELGLDACERSASILAEGKLCFALARCISAVFSILG